MKTLLGVVQVRSYRSDSVRKVIPWKGLTVPKFLHEPLGMICKGNSSGCFCRGSSDRGFSADNRAALSLG